MQSRGLGFPVCVLRLLQIGLLPLCVRLLAPPVCVRLLAPPVCVRLFPRVRALTLKLKILFSLNLLIKNYYTRWN